MIVQANFSALRETRWYEYLIRFTLGGAMTVIAGLIAAGFGPIVGSLFLTFPAIFPASMRVAHRGWTQILAARNPGTTQRLVSTSVWLADASGNVTRVDANGKPAVTSTSGVMSGTLEAGVARKAWYAGASLVTVHAISLTQFADDRREIPQLYCPKSTVP